MGPLLHVRLWPTALTSCPLPLHGEQRHQAMSNSSSGIHTMSMSHVRTAGLQEVLGFPPCPSPWRPHPLSLLTSPVQYNADKAIVDSGTTLLRLPQKVFTAVVEAVARTSLVSGVRAEDWGGHK